MSKYTEKPNTIPWPPIITIGSIVMAWLVNRVFPLDWISNLSSAIWPVGIVMVVVALSVDVWAFRTFNSANTTIMPHQATKNLVTHGPFAWSRNPIYVGNVVLILGIAIAFDNTWMLLAAVVTGIMIYNLAIVREEAHLKANFEEEWNDYSTKVRRWL